jgi:hypothetical protein
MEVQMMIYQFYFMDFFQVLQMVIIQLIIDMVLLFI